jgi:sulfur-carrier protein
MTTLRIPTTMRNDTGGQSSVIVNAATVAEAFEIVAHDCPSFKARLFDAAGRLHGHIAVFVNARDIRGSDGLETKLSEGDEIQIISAIAGG